MCTLYNHKVSPREIIDHFSAVDDWRRDLEKDYASPGRDGYVIVRQNADNVLTAMKWGFPPPANVRKRVVNVRNYASPFSRRTMANPAQRCLVPVSEFQEWSATPDPATGKKKQHWFNLPSQPIFAFVGISRPKADGNVFVFLTCEPNPLVGAVHPKAMPVSLMKFWRFASDEFKVPVPNKLRAPPLKRYQNRRNLAPLPNRAPACTASTLRLGPAHYSNLPL